MESSVSSPPNEKVAPVEEDDAEDDEEQEELLEHDDDADDDAGAAVNEAEPPWLLAAALADASSADPFTPLLLFSCDGLVAYFRRLLRPRPYIGMTFSLETAALHTGHSFDCCNHLKRQGQQ